MARGWESKSVEEQQANFNVRNKQINPISPEEAKKTSERQRLELARANAINQLKLAHNQHYRDLLNCELEEIDRRLAALNKL
jgi:hypothetical protein